jgi:hypothetical protein
VLFSVASQQLRSRASFAAMGCGCERHGRFASILDAIAAQSSVGQLGLLRIAAGFE